MKHNTTEFTNEFPSLIDCGTDYRNEKLVKIKSNPEEEIASFPKQQLMAKCIVDYGDFQHIEEKSGRVSPDNKQMPNESDYILHMSLGLLAECCSNSEVNAIIPRIILNNIALMIDDKFKLEKPKH